MAAFAACSPTSTPARSRSAARRCGAGGSKPRSVPRASRRTARGVLCAPMLAADPGIDTGAWVNAGVSIIVALLAATVLDRAFRARAVRAAAERRGLSREADTRLRFVRRLISVAIVLVGVAVALSGFAGIDRLAASLLASGAIAAAIIGFAARQVLANFV